MRSFLLVYAGNAPELVRERRGDFDAHFAPLLGGLERIARADARGAGPLPDPGAYAGVVVSGSAAGVRDEAPWVRTLARWLEEAVARDVPVLGVCFGHQILGEALGGRVEPNPRGREAGTVEIGLTREGQADPVFFGFPRRFRANAMHRDALVRLPAGAAVLAENANGVQAFRNGSAVGVQFHPEMDGDIARGYIGARAEDLVADGLDPSRLLRGARDCPVATMVVRNWAGLDPRG